MRPRFAIIVSLPRHLRLLEAHRTRGPLIVCSGRLRKTDGGNGRTPRKKGEFLRLPFLLPLPIFSFEALSLPRQATRCSFSPICFILAWATISPPQLMRRAYLKILAAASFPTGQRKSRRRVVQKLLSPTSCRSPSITAASTVAVLYSLSFWCQTPPFPALLWESWLRTQEESSSKPPPLGRRRPLGPRGRRRAVHQHNKATAAQLTSKVLNGEQFAHLKKPQ